MTGHPLRWTTAVHIHDGEPHVVIAFGDPADSEDVQLTMQIAQAEVIMAQLSRAIEKARTMIRPAGSSLN